MPYNREENTRAGITKLWPGELKYLISFWRADI